MGSNSIRSKCKYLSVPGKADGATRLMGCSFPYKHREEGEVLIKHEDLNSFHPAVISKSPLSSWHTNDVRTKAVIRQKGHPSIRIDNTESLYLANKINCLSSFWVNALFSS